VLGFDMAAAAGTSLVVIAIVASHQPGILEA
jgi:hypothetical protein